MNKDVQTVQEKKIFVELTLDEALSLTGVRFPQNPRLEADAMQKIKRGVEKQILEPHKLVQ